MRLFVAADLPAEVRAQLAAAAPGPPWRPVPEEALHVTLAFLGERPEADVRAIAAAMDASVGPPATAELGELVLLPPRRPRVCAVVVRSDGLRDVQRRLAAALADAGVYEPGTRPFLAHVTLARIRERPPRTAVSVSGAFRFERIVLYSSRPGSPGPRYTPLHGSTLQA